MLVSIYFLMLFYFVNCDSSDDISINKIREEGKLLGVETIRDVKIDKDTVISRNVRPHQKKGNDANPHVKKQEPEAEPDPDWSYQKFPDDVKSYVMDFKRNMTECLKEVQKNDKRTVKRLSPNRSSPVHEECLIACVLKRNEIIENGKINKDNLISLVEKFYAKDTTLMKKLNNNLDRCVEISTKVHHDECKLAALLNDCTNDLMISNKHKISVNYT